ncbi:MAG: cyclic nucleotide-binding domain-containing protein [Actinomycetota bacterium]
MGRKEQQISDLALFGGCKAKDVQWVAKTADTIDLPAGCTIAVKGDKVREFVVIVDGVAAGTNDAGDVLLTRGSYFGEMGLMDGRPHTMTITTLTPVRAFVFDARTFPALIERLPSVGRKLMTELVTRLRASEDGHKVVQVVRDARDQVARDARSQNESARNLKAVS